MRQTSNLWFRGESTHKVDGKGRVSIPASFRRVLEEGDPQAQGASAPPRLVLVYGIADKYLECYSMEEMRALENSIAKLKPGSPNRTTLEFIYSSKAMELQIDDSGRLVLAQRLRDQIGLGAEALFVAYGKRFRIFKPESYEREESRISGKIAESGEGFDPLTLLDESES